MSNQPLNPSKHQHGPYKPTLIIHGGAGAISRSNLPPSLYQQYRKSLLRYLTDTKELLDSGASALDAACHAVSSMEDDELFNCGRGSVFTTEGKIEMEASVMVASVHDDFDGAEQTKGSRQPGSIKRGAAVSLVRNTRHPILLAKEVLLDADPGHGLGGTSTMHCHLSGENVEKWGWTEKGLERKGDDWFWTKRRWEEHRRGLGKQEDITSKEGKRVDVDKFAEEAIAMTLPSQGTVGAVCVDAWGNIAVATSTGGLTNKAPGRIGDTPTIGAGFWAESWDKHQQSQRQSLPESTCSLRLLDLAHKALSEAIEKCLPFPPPSRGYTKMNSFNNGPDKYAVTNPPHPAPASTYISPPPLSIRPQPKTPRRAIAMSGTGNGDSFLRTDAVRTAAAICRFSSRKISLSDGVTAVAGIGGELQRSAGNRWEKTGEGQGGIIGIEVERGCRESTVVFDFNCGGLWRAYLERDADGKEIPRVMVFRDE